MELRELALIGDRRTAAVFSRNADCLWYCPGRFDYGSLFGALLDPRAGVWRVKLPGAVPVGRRYRGESAVLETRLRSPGGEWTFTDWMPMTEGAPGAICRRFTAAPLRAEIVLEPRPNYGRTAPVIQQTGQQVIINDRHYLYASHRPHIEDERIRFLIPPGDSGWMILADAPIPAPSQALLDRWRRETIAAWERLAERVPYVGPYAREVRDSLRALRLVSHRATGGILAAATLGLPEVAGGERNYDYRYVWLRDAGMIVSALTRAGSEGSEERRFLEFLCQVREHGGRLPLPPFMTLDLEPPPPETHLDWAGYLDSRPVRIGNNAGTQLQLDGLGNVLLAAKLIYARFRSREHYQTVAEIADFLCEHWREPDHGIWEEAVPRQYTVGKVIAAVGLEFIADHADRRERAEGWRATAAEIRRFVEAECRNSDGAYSAFAGAEAVDVSASLFPVWAYCEADTAAMRSTMAALERDHSVDGLLYRRHLVCDDAAREGVFLAAGFWVAQYWIMRGELERARRIIDAGLRYRTDLGLFPEEGDPIGGRLLGNLPQSFVHAALIGAVVDLRAALDVRDATPASNRARRDRPGERRPPSAH